MFSLLNLSRSISNIRNITEVLRNFNPLETYLQSPAFKPYRVQASVAGNSYRQIENYMLEGHLISGNLLIQDQTRFTDARFVPGRATYKTTIHGFKVYCAANVEVNGDSVDSVITIYVPTSLVKLWENAVPKIFHQEVKPSYHEMTDPNDHNYRYRLEQFTRVGFLDTKMYSDRPLVSDELYDEVDYIFNRMVNNPEYYSDRNIPRKETMLFYGPPGTGKTSMARYFTLKYSMDLIKFNLKVHGRNLHRLLNIIASGKPCVVLVEDIDAYDEFLLPEYRSGKEGSAWTNTVVYSDMINLLSGAIPLNNCIFIMSTNHPEKIRPTVYRMGRVDHLFEIPYPEPALALKLMGVDVRTRVGKYIKSKVDNKIPLEALHQLRHASDIEDVDRVLAKRDISLQLKNQAEYAEA